MEREYRFQSVGSARGRGGAKGTNLQGFFTFFKSMFGYDCAVFPFIDWSINCWFLLKGWNLGADE